MDEYDVLEQWLHATEDVVGRESPLRLCSYTDPLFGAAPIYEVGPAESYVMLSRPIESRPPRMAAIGDLPRYRDLEAVIVTGVEEIRIEVFDLAVNVEVPVGTSMERAVRHAADEIILLENACLELAVAAATAHGVRVCGGIEMARFQPLAGDTVCLTPVEHSLMSIGDPWQGRGAIVFEKIGVLVGNWDEDRAKVRFVDIAEETRSDV